MQNPFVYGEVVPAAAFVNRVAELDRLVGDLAASQKIFLISPRRYGKSSLIRHALPPCRGAARSRSRSPSAASAPTSRSSKATPARWSPPRPSGTGAHVDSRRHPVGTRRGPLRPRFVAARRADRVVSRRAHRARHLAPGAGGVRAAGSAGRRAQAPGRRRARRVPGDQRLQRRLGRARHARGGPAPAPRRLRVRRVGAEPDGADAQARSGRSTRPAPSCGSQKIPADEFAAFIEARFTASGIKPEAGLGAAVVDLAGNLPYDVQRLAHETWDQVRESGRRRATLDDLHQALKRLLSEQQMMFEGVWQRLTLGQRAVAARRRPRRRPRVCCPPTSARAIASAGRRRCRPHSAR